MYYVYGRPLEPTLKFFSDKWGKKLPELSEANSTALKAGFNLGDTMETARNRYQVSKAPVQAGVYRKISGNEALSLRIGCWSQSGESRTSICGLSNHSSISNTRRTISIEKIWSKDPSGRR